MKIPEMRNNIGINTRKAVLSYMIIYHPYIMERIPDKLMSHDTICADLYYTISLSHCIIYIAHLQHY